MPDIIYELNQMQRQERTDALITKIAVILFILIQIPIGFSLAVGKIPNVYFTLLIEFIAVFAAILVYFKKTSTALFIATFFLYIIFSIIPYWFESYHITIPVVMGTFIFNTYIFQEKWLRLINIFILALTLISYYTALYATYEIFYEFIVDTSIGVTAFISIYFVTRYFRKDVEDYEQKLQEVNSFLRQVTDLNPHFIYAKDINNKFIFINETMAQFHGHTSDEMIGQDVGKFYESSETLEKASYIDSKKGKRNYLLVKVMDANNKPTYHELIQTPMLGENRENKGVLGVSINITERKKAETALQKSEQRYKRLYESHQMGVITARSGIILTTNDSFSQMTGYDKNEIIGKKVDDIMHPEDYTYHLNKTKKIVDGSLLGLVFEHRFIRKDKSIGHSLVHLQRLSEVGEPIETIGTITDISQQKKIEEALRESENCYRRLYENHQMGIVSVQKGRFTTVNDKFCEMTGYTRDEIIKQKITSIMHPVDYQTTLEKTQKVDEGKSEGETFEHRFIRKDGTIGYALLHHQLLNIKGKPLEAMATLTDISERKTIEKALRDSENRYRQLYENHQMSIVTTIEGKFVTVNDTFCKMTGYDRAEIIGKRIDDIINAEDYANNIDNARKVNEGVVSGLVFEHRFTRKDNTIGHALIHLQLLYEDGKPTEAIATLTDISQQKTIEKALRQSEYSYRRLYENHQLGIVTTLKGVFTTVNDTFCKMTGYNRDEILGRKVNEIMHPEDYANTHEQGEKVDNRSIPGLTIEHRFIRKDKSIGYALVHIQLLQEGERPVEAIATLTDISQLKQTEQALRKSETIYRKLIENAFDGIEIHESIPPEKKGGKWVHQLLVRNNRIYEMLGKTRQDIKNTSFSTKDILAMSPEIQANGKKSEEYIQEVREELQKNGMVNFEWKYGNTEQTLDTEMTIIGFDIESKKYVTTIYKDITEKKKAEHELQKRETFYRSIFNYAYDGIEIYEIEDQGIFPVDRNERFREMLGWSDEELDRYTGAEISPEYQPNGQSTKALIMKQVKILKQTQKTQYEWRALHKNGHHVDMQVTSVRFSIDGKQMITSIYRDLTEQKKAEIALQESETMYRYLFENAFDGIEIYEYDRVIGAESNLVARNDKLRLLLGRSDEEIDGGEGLSTLQLSPDTQPNGRQSVEHLMEKREEFNRSKTAAFEWQFSHKKGYPVDVYLTLQEYYINNKVILTGFYKDITEQKKAEKTIQQNIDQLHQKNKELQKFIKSNMQLENFAYLASHDLKEPIRTIISFSQLLKRSAYEKLSQTEQEYIDFVIQGSRNMSMLIEDLLAYSRVDTEDKIIQTVNLNDLLYTINYELDTLIKNNKADIKTYELPETIQADKMQIRQLFQNLITNAIRYASPERKPLIKISVEEHKDEWQFAVKDNGIGIKEEFYERIFLLFRKLHGDREKGTGIGLALCKKIAENHGGKIWVESEYGKGSTFYFTINKNPV